MTRPSHADTDLAARTTAVICVNQMTCRCSVVPVSFVVSASDRVLGNGTYRTLASGRRAVILDSYQPERLPKALTSLVNVKSAGHGLSVGR